MTQLPGSGAVRSARSTTRFTPAEVAERKVKQLVHQPYEFALIGASLAPAAPGRTSLGAAAFYCTRVNGTVPVIVQSRSVCCGVPS